MSMVPEPGLLEKQNHRPAESNPETAGGIVMQMVVTRKMDGSTLMVSGTYLTVPDGC